VVVFIAAIPPSGEEYEIRIEGHIGNNRKGAFGGLRVTPTAEGNTTITGIVASDQAALHGVLRTIRDMGLVVLSVYRTTIRAIDDSGGGHE